MYRSAAAFAQRSTDRLTRTPAVPGWSDYVQDNYDKAKEAYVCLVQCGKPRCGLEYDVMYKTRAAFKLALQYCKKHDAQLGADAHAKNLLSRCDYQKFWQGIKKDGRSKSQKCANRVGNAVRIQIFVLCGRIILQIDGFSEI